MLNHLSRCLVPSTATGTTGLSCSRHFRRFQPSCTTILRYLTTRTLHTRVNNQTTHQSLTQQPYISTITCRISTQPLLRSLFPIRSFHASHIGTAGSFTPTIILHSPTTTMNTPSSSSTSPAMSPPPPPSGPSYDAPLPTLEPVAAIDPSELTIEESTLQRLRTLSKQKHGGRPVHLRCLVDQGGCSGLEYKFSVEVDTQPQEEDIVFIFGPNRIYIDRDSWLWLRGSRIIYLEELSRAAFVVSENPNATQACGCKSSFAPKIDPKAATK